MSPVKPKPSFARRCRRLLFWLIAIQILAVAGANVWMVLAARTAITSDPAAAKDNEIGLVLGTSKSIKGAPNPHFTNRIRAAAKLYHEGKVKRLIVSGDNGSMSYNEPRDMSEALVKEGVPRDAIVMDHAGFRTLDSMVRAKKVFEVDRLTVISDGFHLPRAVFLGRTAGLDVSGFRADKVAFRQAAWSEARECLARVKALLDVYVLGTEPKFLGDPVPIHVPVAANSPS